MEQRLENRIYTYSTYLKKKFGRRIFRVGLSTGKKCPHREKTGGCIFCNPETFTGEYQSKNLSIEKQLKDAVPRIKKSCGDVGLIAYFQDDTSTAGEPGFLKRKFAEALSHPEVVGLIVSTRPDYINKEIVELLRSFKVPVSIEIGMQTIHEKSLEFLQRGHNFIEVENAIKLCGENGLNVGVHLIMGIPGENFEDMLQTIKYISSNKYIKQVKFHNLVVYKNTKLAEMLKENGLSLITIDEYIEILAELLPYIRGDIVVSRLFTSNIRRSQIAIENYPGNKTKWMNALRIYLYKKNIIQGMETNKVYKLEKYI